MNYTIKNKILGGKTVCYACEKCEQVLESPLEEAGTNQTCPKCELPFITPGQVELEQQHEEKRQAELASAERTRQAADKADRDAQQKAQRRREKEAERIRLQPEVERQREEKELAARRKLNEDRRVRAANNLTWIEGILVAFFVLAGAITIVGSLLSAPAYSGVVGVLLWMLAVLIVMKSYLRYIAENAYREEPWH